ncbi:MAG TPA: DMT family transporter [Clostridia bacterium]|nr:DMT family transporter [Clostridia bacterium]
MGYLLLFITSLLWSFVGVMVKSASFMADSSVITVSRFIFGVVFLYILMLFKKEKRILYWKQKWIWIGVLGKCCNYIFENIAISNGHAYGNVVVWPVQTIFIAAVSILFFKETLHVRKGAGILLCVTGVVIVSFRGASPSEFFSSGWLTLVLFIFSAIGAGVHLLSQKKLIDSMDPGNMNLSVFLFCSIFTSIPLPFTFHLTGRFSLWSVLSLVGLGFITGLSFYFNAKALKKVPFLTATIISNASLLFTLLWAWLIYGESVNTFILFGAVLLVIGIILANIPDKFKFNFWRVDHGNS